MKKSYDSKFKSRVALEALRGDLTRHEVPQSRTSFVLQPIEKICGEKQKTKRKFHFPYLFYGARRGI